MMRKADYAYRMMALKEEITELHAQLAIRDKAMDILAKQGDRFKCPAREPIGFPCFDCEMYNGNKDCIEKRKDWALEQARKELEE